MTLRKLLRLPVAALLSGFALCGSFSANALPASYYASNSALAKGKWIKIKVDKTGIYELSYESLRQLGFDDPERVTVCGFSPVAVSDWQFAVDKPDDLPVVPTMQTADKLLFYGVANSYAFHTRRSGAQKLETYLTKLRRNLYDDCSYYYLTDSRQRVDVPVAPTPEAAEELEVFTRAQGLSWHEFFDRHPGKVGVYTFSPEFDSDYTMELDLDMPGYEPAEGCDVVAFYTMGTCVSNGRVQPSINGVAGFKTNLTNYMTSRAYTVYNYQEVTSAISNLPKAADDKYTLKLQLQSVEGHYFSGIDYYSVSYPTSTDIAGHPCRLLAFFGPKAGQRVSLSGLPQNATVWEVSSGVAEQLPLEVQADGTAQFATPRDFGNTSGISTSMQTYVFDPSRPQLTPEIVGEVANQNIHGMATPEMLIVSSDICMEQARRLAEVHKAKTGLDVAVVSFSQVCEEFTSGVRHPQALRRAAKMFYDRDPQRFKALLIFGRANVDNTGNSTIYSPEVYDATFIPMFTCQDLNYCGEQPDSYATDMIDGMLADDFVMDGALKAGHLLFAPMQINVGRIPAMDANDAKIYVDKVESYLDTPRDVPAYNRAVVTADLGDGNMHLTQAEALRKLIAKISPATVVNMHLQGLYNPKGGSHPAMRSRMTAQLQRGLGMWFFYGHSLSSASISTNSYWNIANDAGVVTNYPTFTVYGTCSAMKIDSPEESIQLAQLFNPTGGSIAAVGSTRPSYATHNDTPVMAAALGYYSLGADATFGDIVRFGRNRFAANPGEFNSSYNTSYMNAANYLNYNFIGDPMLPAYLPEGSVKITTWNGAAADYNGITDVYPLVSNTIAGEVLNAAGERDASFNGTLTMLVYDGPHTASTKATADSENPVKEVELAETVLQEVKFEVVEGRFSGKLTFAFPSYLGDSNHISLYAVTSDKKRSAVGANDNMRILQDTSADISELQAPVIEKMYAADEEYTDNSLLSSDFMLYAEVAPAEVSLLGASDRFGGGMSLSVDNSQSLSGVDGFLTIRPDGSASLAYPVTGLADGYHTLTFTVRNVAGLSASRSVNVNVMNVASARTTVDSPFAREKAVIDLEHNLGDEIAGRVVVTGSDGSAVFTAENVAFPYTWNLCGTDGRQVPDGFYTVRAYFHSGLRYGSSTPASVTVGR